MLGVKQIKTDGTEVDLGLKKLSLEEAQKLVSTGMQKALIEHVAINDSPWLVGGETMFVNEEGLLYGLSTNLKASVIAKQMIVGDCIIIRNEESDFT